MKELLLFILSILAWLASVFGSDIQPNNEGYPPPFATGTPAANPLPPCADCGRSTPEPTARWQHYAP